MKYHKYLWWLFFFLITFTLRAQPLTDVQIEGLVVKYKKDLRGPYRDIRWFCHDGSVIPPKSRCPAPGGVQRARYKNEVIALGASNHIFFGQILSTTKNTEFWDVPYRHSRIKQYQLEKFLRAAAEGWILKRAQYYRGALQIEDEEDWGLQFFHWLLADPEVVKQHYFLIREAARDLPHRGDNYQAQMIRALSKTIAETYTAFNNLRIKIHGQPEAEDVAAVKQFEKKHHAKLSAREQRQFDRLIREMESYYLQPGLYDLLGTLQGFSENDPIKRLLKLLAQDYDRKVLQPDQLEDLVNFLWQLRFATIQADGAKERLALIDLSIKIENLLFQRINEWKPNNVQELLFKTFQLAKAAAACGFMEIWEWEQAQTNFYYNGAYLNLDQLATLHQQSQRWTEWGTGMVRSHYREVVDLYSGFEPLANGFIDDRIRSSILLPLGNSVSQLGELIAGKAEFSNQVMDLSQQSEIRGLNPGYALGELVVVSGSPEAVKVDKNKIYVFNRPSSKLKPVAGIATVTEGNPVSHIQLLARNLGIPNAVLSAQNLEDLAAYHGRKVFYAVSNRGTVLMKLAEEMTEEEQNLFAVEQQLSQKIEVPLDKLDLSERRILNLREVDATASGRWCGPKAANLGQLKVLFPDRVVEGLVIPFGVFRSHLDQPMPGQDRSYWQYLREIFKEAREMEEDQYNEKAVEEYVFKELTVMREAIRKIPLQPTFVLRLKYKFFRTFNRGLGSVPVFLRSDTNMEDLKEFTGAGLNKTVFNAVAEEAILQGIKDVWASPFTERSYRWRQRFLKNPEQVFPSILIIPTVDVDYSGVLITKGISSDQANDLTLAFNLGAGGAVDGQAAEIYLLRSDNDNVLLSPAREPYFRKLPETGGSVMVPATFENPILTPQNLKAIRNLADDLRRQLPYSPGIESAGPFDVEFGFKDQQIWLFQVRPFVENKQAKGSTYLEEITPELDRNKRVRMDELL